MDVLSTVKQENIAARTEINDLIFTVTPQTRGIKGRSLSMSQAFTANNEGGN